MPDIKQFLAEEWYQHESNQSQIAPLNENAHHRDVRRTDTLVPSNNMKIKILVRTLDTSKNVWLMMAADPNDQLCEFGIAM